MHLVVPLVYGPDDRRHEQNDQEGPVLLKEFREPTADEEICTRDAKLQRDELEVAPGGLFEEEVHEGGLWVMCCGFWVGLVKYVHVVPGNNDQRH